MQEITMEDGNNLAVAIKFGTAVDPMWEEIMTALGFTTDVDLQSLVWRSNNPPPLNRCEKMLGRAFSSIKHIEVRTTFVVKHYNAFLHWRGEDNWAIWHEIDPNDDTIVIHYDAGIGEFPRQFINPPNLHNYIAELNDRYGMG